MSTSAFSISSLPYPFSTKDLKIGIAVAEWNRHITMPLLEGAQAVLQEAGIGQTQIELLQAPGAFELGLCAKWLTEAGCDGVICIGCVIRGETPHFEYVSQAAVNGILNAGMESGKPVIFGVLTTENETQALDRIGGKHGHKGREAAETLLWMLAINQKINS